MEEAKNQRHQNQSVAGSLFNSTDLGLGILKVEMFGSKHLIKRTRLGDN
jgi:hypothetical protein